MALADFDVTGKRVLVTGAGRGIGRGIALAFADAGADVAITSLGEPNAAKVASEVQALGRRGFGWAADGTSVEAMERIRDAVLEALGGIDVIVNCVGDSIPGTVAQAPGGEGRVMTEADWHKVIDLNLTQAFVGSHVFGPTLLEQRSGCAINISSFAATRAGAVGLSLASVGPKPTMHRVLLSAAFLTFAFFMLTMKMHERYLFPALALLAPVAILDRRWAVLYVALSVTFLLNLYSIYPVPPPAVVGNIHYIAAPADIWLSALNCGLFLAFAMALVAAVPAAWSGFRLQRSEPRLERRLGLGDS